MSTVMYFLPYIASIIQYNIREYIETIGELLFSLYVCIHWLHLSEKAWHLIYPYLFIFKNIKYLCAPVLLTWYSLARSTRMVTFQSYICFVFVLKACKYASTNNLSPLFVEIGAFCPTINPSMEVLWFVVY